MTQGKTGIRWGRWALAGLVIFAAAFWFRSDLFPQQVRAALDQVRLAHYLKGNPWKYDACYASGFEGEDCRPWRVRKSDEQEYWPYHETSPVKWPAEPAERTYRPGMTPWEYFVALCEKEGGEFITRTERAESIYMIRPRREIIDPVRNYDMEDPYGYGQGDEGEMAGWDLIGSSSQIVTPHYPPDYVFAETPVLPKEIRPHPASVTAHDPEYLREPPPGKRFTEFYWDNEKPSTWTYKFSVRYVDSLVSRYGYTWRGIRRPYDRELGVSGGETAVVDLATGEILGLRRGFLFSGSRGNAACPRYSQMPGVGKVRGKDKDINYTRLFLTKVIQPTAIPMSEEEHKGYLKGYEGRRQEQVLRDKAFLEKHGIRGSGR